MGIASSQKARGSQRHRPAKGEYLSAESNWELTKALLTARIRRRFIALQRLANVPADTESIDQELESCGDDVKSLWALAERIDRALDSAMSPRSTRTPLADIPPTVSHAEFRAR
jgi:hypothetical protein